MADGSYRCAVCGDGQHLTAYAQTVSCGPLRADGGDLLSFDETYTCFIFGDSVSCSLHGEREIEVLVEGEWSVWSRCGECGGRGRVGAGRHPRYPDGWRCDKCQGAGGRYVSATSGAAAPPEPEVGGRTAENGGAP